MGTPPPESDWETSNNQHSTSNIEGCPGRSSTLTLGVRYSMFDVAHHTSTFAPLCGYNRLFRFHFAFARREFKRDLALVVHHEIRRKRFPGLGDELVEQIGLVRGQQFLRLRRLNRLLQNFPVDPEFARLGVRLRLLAKIARLRVENLAAALRTFAERFLAGKINLRQRLLRRCRPSPSFSVRAARIQTPCRRP